MLPLLQLLVHVVPHYVKSESVQTRKCHVYHFVAVVKNVLYQKKRNESKKRSLSYDNYLVVYSLQTQDLL